jgi:hypothetical protein
MFRTPFVGAAGGTPGSIGRGIASVTLGLASEAGLTHSVEDPVASTYFITTV